MKLREFKQGEVIVQENNLAPDLFVVLTGTATSSTRTRVGQSWGCFKAFGELEELTGALWEPTRITAQNHCTVIQVPGEPLKSLMSRIRQSLDYSRMTEFLSMFIPGMRFFGHSAKERVSACFHAVRYAAKRRILREGERAATALIVSAGVCLEVGNAGQTFKLNLGLITRGQWVGLESVLTDIPMKHSIFAQSDIEGYEISKADLMDKVGKDTVALLREEIDRKAFWRESRKSVISETLSPFMGNQENERIELPTATPAIKNRIRQLHRLKDRDKSPNASHRSESAPRHYALSANQSNDQLPEVSPINQTARSLNVSFWYSQFPKGAATLRPTTQGEKHRLHFAATLGKTMVPAIGKVVHHRALRKGKQTRVTGGSVKQHFGYEHRDEQYSQQLKQRREERRDTHVRWESL